MQNNFSVSVVIPTCNRKESLLRLLPCLDNSDYVIEEVIIVDSGDEYLQKDELNKFKNLLIKYIPSRERSVCIQRNEGIRQVKSSWIFLCDDDLEVPRDYLKILFDHAVKHPEAGAMSGLVLQKDTGEWMEQYPVTSTAALWLKFIFQLSIWGEIKCHGFGSNFLKRYYEKRKNHLSKAGWPVITHFEGEYFKSPVYGLGASVVKKDWLLKSPYDEVLDPHGIGDNYGVAIGFPGEGIHIVKAARVYHHKIEINRIQRPNQYYRRGLALHYFLTTRKELRDSRRGWFLWSLLGNTFFILSGERFMLRVNFQLIKRILLGNPYVEGKRKDMRCVKPEINRKL